MSRPAFTVYWSPYQLQQVILRKLAGNRRTQARWMRSNQTRHLFALVKNDQRRRALHTIARRDGGMLINIQAGKTYFICVLLAQVGIEWGEYPAGRTAI